MRRPWTTWQGAPRPTADGPVYRRQGPNAWGRGCSRNACRRGLFADGPPRFMFMPTSNVGRGSAAGWGATLPGAGVAGGELLCDGQAVGGPTGGHCREVQTLGDLVGSRPSRPPIALFTADKGPMPGEGGCSRNAWRRGLFADGPPRFMFMPTSNVGHGSAVGWGATLPGVGVAGGSCCVTGRPWALPPGGHCRDAQALGDLVGSRPSRPPMALFTAGKGPMPGEGGCSRTACRVSCSCRHRTLAVRRQSAGARPYRGLALPGGCCVTGRPWAAPAGGAIVVMRRLWVTW